MSSAFDFSTGALEVGAGLILAPGHTTASHLSALDWKALESVL
jgi:hypothetical protein